MSEKTIQQGKNVEKNEVVSQSALVSRGELDKLDALLKDTLDPQDRNSLIRFEILRILSQMGQQILNPLSAQGLPFLYGGLFTSSLSSATNSRVELKIGEQHRKQSNNVTCNLVDYVNTHMPECERDAKSSSFLRNKIRSIAGDQANFTRANFTLYTSVVASLISAGVLGATSLPFLLACGPSAFVGWFMGRKSTQIFRNADLSIMQAQNNTNKSVDNSLNSGRLGEAAKDDALKKLRQNVSREGVLWSEPQNKSFKTSLWASGINCLTVSLVVGAAYLLGLDLPHIASIYASTMAFTAATTTFWAALHRRNSAKNTINTQICDLAHSRVYDLTYGNQFARDNTNTIVLNNICYAYRNNKPDNVTENVNGVEKKVATGEKFSSPILEVEGKFVIGPGITVLGGRSNAGKTTLYKLLRHGDDLDSGEILFGNNQNVDQAIPLTQLAKSALEPYVSSAFQSFSDGEEMNVLEFIKTGAKHVADEDIIKHAQSIGLGLTQDKVYKDCSGGEQKKAIFLRTILSDAEIFLFDEPTSGVDETSASLMLKKVNELARMGKTVIFTTHRGDELYRNLNTSDENEERLQINQILHLDYEKDKDGSRLGPTKIKVFPTETKEQVEDYVKKTTEIAQEDSRVLPQVSLEDTHKNTYGKRIKDRYETRMRERFKKQMQENKERREKDEAAAKAARQHEMLQKLWVLGSLYHVCQKVKRSLRGKNKSNQLNR